VQVGFYSLGKARKRGTTRVGGRRNRRQVKSLLLKGGRVWGTGGSRIARQELKTTDSAVYFNHHTDTSKGGRKWVKEAPCP